LIGQGHDVIALDNLITGRAENIAHLIGNPKFSFVKYNVCDYLHVDGQLDAVMHFASPASPQDYLEMPIATLKVGALGTHKALGIGESQRGALSYWPAPQRSMEIRCSIRNQKPIGGT
jgi:dTDP-glucose 4,6-dehydratase